jgi:hypothetical protein
VTTHDFAADLEALRADPPRIVVGTIGCGVVPPRVRPPNEAAGYLGYYAKRFLPVTFDLVDIDGTSPVAWIYNKSARQVFRFIEEKPFGQQLHDSQRRILRTLVDRGHEAFVVYSAHQLADNPPTFPIPVAKLAANPNDDIWRTLTREEFDRWLTLT